MCTLTVSVPSPVEHQICPAVCVLMKLSFDEEHRHAMNELGEYDTKDWLLTCYRLASDLILYWFTLWVICPCRRAAGSGGAAAGGL